MKLFNLLFFISFLILGCSSDNESEEEINAIALPKLTTTDISEINPKSALSGADIQDNGGGNIISKGICWSVDENPTIDDYKTDEGIGNSSFTSALIELRPNTQYYVRAYATNESGTAYGNEIRFKTDHFIYEGHVALKSQSEVDEFGALGYTIINGALNIGEIQVQSDISSLTNLKDLTVIEEVLTIEGIHSFESLSGLQNLNHLGAMYIRDTKITNLDELINLTELNGGTSGGGISFLGGNENLRDIDGLRNIEKINGWLDINNNPSLENIDGLISLRTISNLTIDRNNKITNLDALININSTLTFLEIERNQSLENIDGLRNVMSINFRLIIDDNPVLKDFCALSSIALNEEEFNFIISNNLYNPTREDIKNGQCKL
ncbi:hypothetical protein L0P88_22930 [Muricauda sp. SCSIO 64092]|uniref:hypothetical protein n=1 Tax=Allomuricauda sp. SCSIO 64092 TaxID=2908842 RepID=UPI001FF31EAD|nr:hypothetical protein [Muricauda sp. SCSIO 64092]UOY06759.1 hypothetical protein L0P88_22930 [Muricauda sp. SCSIO 64092]